MNEAEANHQEYARALERARRGVWSRSLIVGLGSATGAALGVLALAAARGHAGSSPDALAAAACAGVAVFLVSWKRPTPAAAAARLDRMLGTEAFGAALAGRGPLDSLCSREAVAELRGRDPARLGRGDVTHALIGPAAGLALWILAPLAALPQENDSARARAIDGAARAGSLASAGANVGIDAAAAEVVARAAAARAAPADERARADADLRRALQALLAEMGESPSGEPGARDDMGALADRAIAALERQPPPGGVAASPADRSAPPGAPSGAAGGGAVAASAPGASRGTLFDPGNPSQAGAAVAAEPWPVRYDAIVRRYFGLAPADPRPEAAESTPAPPTSQRYR
jgi:hypothetical protein